MRIDKFKIKKEKTNVVNILEGKSSFNSDFKDYKDKHWIVGRTNENFVRVDTILPEEHFYKNKDLMIKIFNFVKSEQQFLTDKSTHVLCYDMRYFFRYLIKENDVIDLSVVDYDFIDKYALSLKANGESKNKYEKIKKVLNKMKKYPYFELHDDIYNGNYPIHQNFKKAKKQNDSYDEDTFKNLASCLTSIIEDYFKGKVSKKSFIKASYWFIAFCTGFNKTAMDNLSSNHIEITKANDDIFYLITGLKNRGNKGYQQSRISVKRGHIFEKVITELIKQKKSMNKAYTIKDDCLFYYEEKKKNTFLKKFQGFNTVDSKTKPYFKKYNIEGLALSTQKIRNQWSLKMLSISESVNKVSILLDHSNTDITLSHYLKSRLNEKTIIKFKAFQELLYQYSHNENFDRWTDFQMALEINKDELEEVIKKIKEGYYEKASGQCINKENINCSNYLNCFNCNNYSIIGEKDLWKIMSMREAVVDSKNIKFNWLLETIDETLKEFDSSEIMKARKLKNEKGRHPFWKNQIMIKTLMDNYKEI